jgi:hypothetical protein
MRYRVPMIAAIDTDDASFRRQEPCTTNEPRLDSGHAVAVRRVRPVAVAPTATAQGSAQAAIFRPEELRQLVALVALYPDALLAQVFIAFYWWPLRRAWVTRAS